MYLNSMGAYVSLKQSGDTLLSEVLQEKPDLVLIDAELAGGSGWSALRTLLADTRTVSTPVVILTDEDHFEPGEWGDHVAILFKPVNRRRLVEAIRQAMSGTAGKEAAPPQGEQGVEAPLLLVVEDHPENQLAFCDYLGAKGYRVIAASNGEEAVDLTRSERPDLILMDIQMPGMDGLEAMRQIRAEASLREIPIIALTALTMPGDQQRCLDAGATDYLGKPVRLRELAQLVDGYLKKN